MQTLNLTSSQSLNSNAIYDTLKSGADFISENHVTIISVFLLSLFVGAACAGFSGFGLLAFSGSMAVWTTLHAGSILGGLGALGGLTALCTLGKMFFSRESAPQAQAQHSQQMPPSSRSEMFFNRESAPQAQAQHSQQMSPSAAPTESIPSQVESTPPSAVNPPVEKRCAEIINPGDENENENFKTLLSEDLYFLSEDRNWKNVYLLPHTKTQNASNSPIFSDPLNKYEESEQLDEESEQLDEESEQLDEESDMEKIWTKINPQGENENFGEQWVKEFDKDGKASIADETQDKSGQPKTVNENQSEEKLSEAQKTGSQPRALAEKRISQLLRHLIFADHPQQKENSSHTTPAARL